VSDRPIIIVRKKKVAHAAHHGGSWKVAYADFVTAMMAFFLVMWIVGMDQGVKDMVQGYFQQPIGFRQTYSGGANPISAGNFITNIDVDQAVVLSRPEQHERFEETASHIRSRIEDGGLLDGLAAAVETSVTEEGLRIEFMETSGEEAFFAKGSAELTLALRSVIGVVWTELEAIPGDIVIEGHTDAVPFGGPRYSNWELSVDRANASRREMSSLGLPDARVAEVRGYAARRPKIQESPADPRNRRISVLLPFMEADTATAGASDAEIAYLGPGVGAPPPAAVPQPEITRTTGEERDGV